MIHTQIFFTCLTDNLNVRPIFEKGKTDSIWVVTNSENENEIKAAAIRKAEKCYGLEVSNLELCNQYKS